MNQQLVHLIRDDNRVVKHVLSSKPRCIKQSQYLAAADLARRPHICGRAPCAWRHVTHSLSWSQICSGSSASIAFAAAPFSLEMAVAVGRASASQPPGPALSLIWHAAVILEQFYRTPEANWRMQSVQLRKNENGIARKRCAVALARAKMHVYLEPKYLEPKWLRLG